MQIKTNKSIYAQWNGPSVTKLGWREWPLKLEEWQRKRLVMVRRRNSIDTGLAKFTGVVKDTVEKLESDDSEDDDHEQHQ